MAKDKEEVKESEDVKESEEDKPKKSKLKLIIIGVLVLLLGGGGFYGYSKYKQGKEETLEKEEKARILCPLKSFVVNLYDKRGIGKRYLKITMILEVETEEDSLKIEENMPQLRDTILILLSSLSLKEINSMEAKLALKHEILLRVNQLLGNNIVHKLYFTELVVQ
ncbi:MAG: flagellar basal body-associated FliL family protein [Spirochaetes bacterium]|nr:flagellar basal body-associated FliL family protein [Spirochaetota bacterium]